jgi:hypothetical protein
LSATAPWKAIEFAYVFAMWARETAAKTKAAALSASSRTMSAGIPISSRAISTIYNAVAVAAIKLRIISISRF